MSNDLVEVPRQVLKELIGAVRSINRGKAHEIRVPGDDQPCYWQRKEWVDWSLEVAENLAAEVALFDAQKAAGQPSN
ncbi:MAG: hypothetical protein ACNJA3_28475 (plasmid) [Pseudomonas rhizophila]|uniref:hypothetical protein n=1 Tax=Pseudomonas rhizophila TaxID=2045200 RepID=UPI003F6A8274